LSDDGLHPLESVRAEAWLSEHVLSARVQLRCL